MICVFNPEHDLCLANGSPHYMPPASALLFARRGAALMRVLYPDAEAAVPAAAFSQGGPCCRSAGMQIVPWGWNRVLREQLLSHGVLEADLPPVSVLERWRALQHRATYLALLPDSRAVTTVCEVEGLLSRHRHLVLKAPWSGSGRGIRWVSERMVGHDAGWLEKVVRTQQCAIAEPRRQVSEEFAVEYWVGRDGVRLCGFSLFVAANGVYRSNLLLCDDEIRQRVRYADDDRAELEGWLRANVVGRYEGPLGVDYIRTIDGVNYLSEINFRHTMGMVAHQFLLQNPSWQGKVWTPGFAIPKIV